jgi:hypothetical protein
VAGNFSLLDGIPRQGIARLNRNGALDETFDTGSGPDGLISNLALDVEGNLLLAGTFTEVDGRYRSRMARLLAETPPLPDGPPTILAHPEDQVVTAGKAATFSVWADAAPPIGQQWLKDGSPIENATNSQLTISRRARRTLAFTP